MSETGEAPSLISMDEIIGKLNSFFTDSVILKINYQIETLGGEVETLLGLSSEEVTGHLFSRFCSDQQIHSRIENELRRGYFDGVMTSLLNRENEFVKVSISGFYLGLISDINGYIILKVKVLEDSTFLKKELITKKRELDSFIYRTAHDLRGPIATIKGLVNLLKMRNSEHEVDELTSLIEIHANKLDDRLFKLLYVADNTKDPEKCEGIVDFASLKTILKQTLVNNFQIENTDFHFITPEQPLQYVNEFRLTRLLNNLLLYIIGLPISSISKDEALHIAIHFVITCNEVKVRVHTKGFVASDKIREVIRKPVSLYNDILNYPFLFNYFVAQQETRHLNGNLTVDFGATDEHFFCLSIPFNFSLRPQAKGTTPSI